MSEGGGGGSSSTWYSAATIQSDLPIEEIMNHYLTQLDAKRAQVTEVVGGKALKSALFKVKGARDTRWQGTMTVHSMQNGKYRVRVDLALDK
jgi:hypothetical protein